MKQNLHFQKKKISRLFFYENPTREKQINKTSSFSSSYTLYHVRQILSIRMTQFIDVAWHHTNYLQCHEDQWQYEDSPKVCIPSSPGMCWSGRRARNRGHVRVAYGHPRHSRASCPQPGDTVNSDQISITVGTTKIGRKWPIYDQLSTYHVDTQIFTTDIVPNFFFVFTILL